LQKLKVPPAIYKIENIPTLPRPKDWEKTRIRRSEEPGQNIILSIKFQEASNDKTNNIRSAIAVLTTFP
jgi:hypothetical protein